MVRFAIRAAMHIAIRAAAAIDYVFSRNKDLTTTIVANDKLAGAKLLIYAMWSSDGLPSKPDELLLKSFKNQGFDIVVAINADRETRRKLQNSVHAAWSTQTSILLVRKNRGRDMAAYRDALRYVKKQKLTYSQVIFANNSVLWLPSKLDNFVSTLVELSNSPVYSATVSFQPFPHAQTFLFGANSNGIDAIEKALDSIRNTIMRTTAVIYGELKFAKSITKFGYSPTALFEYKRILQKAYAALLGSCSTNNQNEIRSSRLKMLVASEARGQALNPTHFMWLELYELGFPGIKKDLLYKNPSRIIDIPLLTQLIEEQDTSVLSQAMVLSKLGYNKKVNR